MFCCDDAPGIFRDIFHSFEIKGGTDNFVLEPKASPRNAFYDLPTICTRQEKEYWRPENQLKKYVQVDYNVENDSFE